MGQTRRKGSRNTDKRQEKRNKSFCYIPIRRPVTKFLSSEKDANFYEYVNNEWISTVKMPMFENDFSVSEEVERCVYKKSVEILNHLDESSPMKTLRDSCLINRIQPRNIEYLTLILRSIQCIDSPKKVIKHFAALCQSRIPSLFNYQYKISSNGEVNLLIDSGSCGLPISYYSQPDKMAVYKKFLDTVGDYFEINELSQIYEFEKTLVQKSEEYYSDND